MLRNFFNLFHHHSTTDSLPQGETSEAAFQRKLESSNRLRHMCGFDSEHFQAIHDMRQ